MFGAEKFAFFTLDSPAFPVLWQTFIIFSYLWCSCYELGPALPLRTPVPVLERRLVGLPAAVLVVEPEADETHAALHVRQPVGCDVDATGQSTWRTERERERESPGQFCLCGWRCDDVYWANIHIKCHVHRYFVSPVSQLFGSSERRTKKKSSFLYKYVTLPIFSAGAILWLYTCRLPHMGINIQLIQAAQKQDTEV